METRANYVAVGIFTLAAMMVAFVMVYWFGQYDGREDLVPLKIRIEGSVSGLGQGSLVTFNGIDVGRVESLALDETDPRFVIVTTKINPNTPVRTDTRASIGIRGLSGGAFIQMEGGSPVLPAVLAGVTPDGEAPIIRGDPAALADLLKRINDLANTAERVMRNVETFVVGNSASVSRTLNNVEVFSQALSENSAGVDQFLRSTSSVADSLTNLSAKLDGSVTRIEEILQAVEPSTVTATLNNVETTSKQLVVAAQNAGDALAQVNQIVTTIDRDAIRGTVENINTAAQRLNGLVERLDTSSQAILGAVDPEQLRTILTNAERLTSDAQSVVAAIDPGKLGQTVDDISQTAANARNLVAGVDQDAIRNLVDEMGKASRNVTTILEALDAAKINEAVDGITSAATGAQRVVDDVSAVTRRFRDKGDDVDRIFADATELTARLNESSKRVDGLLEQVDALLGSGQADGLVAEARATLATFRSTAASLERQIGSIAGDINNFTRRGLGDTQGLIKDARQSLGGLNRVIRNLESNPSSLITGAGGSRIGETSSGRPRR
ncbi:MAG: MlaD family protein [Ahrensia sp.]|nr:MlaD family protein [Ahrensia sp.]